MSEGLFAQHAAKLQEAGFIVIPVNGKTPAVQWKSRKRRYSRKALDTLIKKFGHCNIGILTGPSGITVVDVDDISLVSTMIQRCGETPIQIATPSGGMHLYYKGTYEQSINQFDGLAVDIKSVGGFVVAPPSINSETGKPYSWATGSLLDMSDLPTVIKGSLPKASASGQSALEIPSGETKIFNGNRNNGLFSREVVPFV